jgi:hypothetical protein
MLKYTFKYFHIINGLYGCKSSNWWPHPFNIVNITFMHDRSTDLAASWAYWFWQQIIFILTQKTYPQRIDYNSIIVTNTIIKYIFKILPHHKRIKGSTWLWSYGSCIYNYLCNQCLSLLKLWGGIPLISRCTRCNIMWWSLSVVFSGYYRFLHQ